MTGLLPRVCHRIAAVSGLVLAAVIASALGTASPATATPDRERTPVIVVLTDTGVAPELAGPASRSRAAAVARLAAIPESAIGHRFGVIPGFAAELTAAEITRLEADPRVAGVVADELRAPQLDGVVPLVDADALHAIGDDGGGWTVAVLDTGFELSHPFLTGKATTGNDGSGSGGACFAKGPDLGDAIGDCPGGTISAIGPAAAAPCPAGTSGCGHGTSVAGIAVGADGVSGALTFDGLAPGAGLLPVRVFSEFSGTDCTPAPSPCALAWDSDVIAGLDHVFAQRAHYDIASVNLSLGGGKFGQHCDAITAYAPAIDQLSDVGIAVTVATGNNGFTNGISVPSCVESAIAVTATTDGDILAGFSNADDIVDLAAPGVSIRTSAVSGSYTSGFSGTSAAAPVVAGAYAILREAFPDEPLDRLTAALKASPVTITEGANAFPRIDLDHAYAQLAGLAAPTSVSATGGDGQVTVSWTWAPDPATALSPASPPEFRLTDLQTGQILDIAGTLRSTTWTGLPTGKRAFTVAPVTGAGLGTAATSGLATVAGPPGPVQNLSVSPERAGLAVSWSPPADDGGKPVTGYQVTAGGTTTTVTGTSTTVTGLATATGQTVSVSAVNARGTGPGVSGSAVTLSPTAGTFTPLPPIRILDTRFTAAPKPGPDTTLTLPIAGTNGVPADATAVVVNLTGVDATDDGFVTAHPSATPRPTASNLNLARDDIRPNLAIVPLGPDGAIALYTQSGTHLVVDLAGYWHPGDLPATSGRYRSAPVPIRILDTRFTAAPKPGPDTTLTLPIAGTNGVPADATAVVVNLTGVDATDDGFVTAHPSATPRPTASNLNLARDDIRPNLAIVPLGPDGAIALYTQSGTHLVVDLAGWFTGASEPAGTSGLFTAVTPIRTLDTRFTGASKPAGGETVGARVTGAGGVPPSVAAVALNLTGVDATDDGFVTAHPSGTNRPTASNLNLARGQTVPNAAIVGAGSTGTVSLYTDRGAHLITDVAGWFNG